MRCSKYIWDEIRLKIMSYKEQKYSIPYTISLDEKFSSVALSESVWGTQLVIEIDERKKKASIKKTILPPKFFIDKLSTDNQDNTVQNMNSKTSDYKVLFFTVTVL